MKIICFFLLVFISTDLYSQSLTNEEMKLYNLITAYRRSKGLSKIPLSRSLTIVAKTHVKDLEENYIENDSCNLHSWSDNGDWEACCYTDDHAQAELMWSKPGELTSYKDNGYEIAFENGDMATASLALKSWKNSVLHNAVILNQNIWKEKWNAIGIGIFGKYAVVWFGNALEK